ncbi:hypothetical protein A9200_08755 [Maribacter hydrothermalis]|uniref:Peptidase family M48 n=2 Tax=Maribacter hydrothermalis TaxID=1836467 RepID=A0A1B7Z265_9FLAO|nr:hypothetical protein BTR34_12865 [Maribacter hydrothermalis]OBR36746.1 hypothetical protein A9200_08755 [Maribacter hydrothermalis]
MAKTPAFSQNVIPESIKDEIKIALTYYPNLQNNPIEFKFRKNIKKSTMLAQPDFWSLFKSKKKRKYKVLISEKIVIAGNAFATKDIPKDVMIGWIGHELGHIVDYKNRSSLNLIWFGIKYTFSDSYIKEAERAADTHAVNHGMESYILATKNFILNNADINESYKLRIRKYYLSPEEIMVLINERNKAEKE